MSLEKTSTSILGNRIDCFKDFEALYQYILTDKANGCARGYVTVNNTHTMMEGFWSRSYQEIINQSYLSIPDGKPLQIFGKLKGKKQVARLFGPSVMENFIDWGRKDKIRHFFIGGSDKSLQQLKTSVETKYPGVIICGMISPPYAPVEEWDNDAFIRQINEAKADFIWVGLGAPKQEKWMYSQYRKVETGLLFGIGAAFSYMAGNTRHAPQWMKKTSLEWLYRLIQEPGRLWKRYLKTIPAFMFFGALDLAGLKFRRAKPSAIVNNKAD